MLLLYKRKIDDFDTRVGIAISHEKRENGKFVDEKFLTGKSDEKNGKLSSLK